MYLLQLAVSALSKQFLPYLEGFFSRGTSSLGIFLETPRRSVLDVSVFEGGTATLLPV